MTDMHTFNNPDQALRGLVESSRAVLQGNIPTMTASEAALAVVGLRVQVSPRFTNGDPPIQAFRRAWFRQSDGITVPGLGGRFVPDGTRLSAVGTIIGLREYTPCLEWSELGRQRIGLAALVTVGLDGEPIQSASIHQAPSSWFIR